MSVTPSSLGSYFGVGFNTPQEQLDIDLGVVEPEFDDDAKDRMLLGRSLEQGMLNYFEEKFGIKITNRNEETYEFYDGKIRGKVDGLTVINGVNTVVECKISNSQMGKFTEDIGYFLQCQAYLLGLGYEQALLCGQYQGKPVYRFIRRNEAVIADIKKIVDFITDVFFGFDTFDNYPMDVVSKYSTVKVLPSIRDVSPELVAKAEVLLALKVQEKSIGDQISKIEDEFKTTFDEGIFENQKLKITVSNQQRAGGYDIDRLSIDHPEIEFERYRKEPSKFRALRVTGKKGA